MNTKITFEEIIQDEAYTQGYTRSQNIANRKYERLRSAAERFLNVYDSIYGEPTEFDEYFELRKIVKKNGILPTKI